MHGREHRKAAWTSSPRRGVSSPDWSAERAITMWAAPTRVCRGGVDSAPGDTTLVISDTRKLFLIHEVAAAVLLPAAFVFFHAERLFFAVADGLDAAGAYSGGYQSVLYCTCALIA